MKMKQMLAAVLAAGMLSAMPEQSFADAVPGDTVITLGESLTPAQKEMILKEMAATENAQVITVSNQEEHQYLSKYIPKAQIGTKAISSTKIVMGEANSGLSVQTNNINWVSKEMYTNALTTAGVKDAEIYVTAPFDVSGTAALTGLIKAYEITADIEIPEEQKQIANEEMVTTAKLGEQIGQQEANLLMAKVKEEMVQNPPATQEEMKQLVQETANSLNININIDQLNNLTLLFFKMQGIDIDWGQVENQMQEQVANMKEKWKGFSDSAEGKEVIESTKGFWDSLVALVKSWFGGSN